MIMRASPYLIAQAHAAGEELNTEDGKDAKEEDAEQEDVGNGGDRLHQRLHHELHALPPAQADPAHEA